MADQKDLMKNKKRIVVVGAGFGGIYTYLYLRKKFHNKKNSPEITIIDKNNYFLFTPLLHEVATGSIQESNIIQPIRQVFNSDPRDLIIGKIKAVNPDKQEIIFNHSNKAARYDCLVMATGAQTKMYGFPKELAFVLKDLGDAHRIKNQIIDSFNNASNSSDKDKRKRFLTFVIIGGGPTGVELAAEIYQFVCETLTALYPRVTAKEIKIYLIHAQKSLLNNFHPYLRKKTKSLLNKKSNIEVILNTRVERITPDSVILSNGKKIPTATPILVAGIEPVPIDFIPKTPLNKSGQIEVNEYLQLPGYQNVFVIGDMARMGYGGNFAPQTAQAAIIGAKTVAHNIAALMENKPLVPFQYKERGQLVSVGNWSAAGKISGLKFSGPFAWLLWRGVYASKLIGWTNRIKVAVDWIINFFYQRDISRL